MNRDEFLYALERNLKPLPREEITNALDYYREYIDEIPLDRQNEEISKLGNPKHIASRLIAEFSLEDNANATSVFLDSMEPTRVQSKTRQKSTVSVWTVVFAVLSAPITIPFAIALIAVLFALIVSFGAVVLALFVIVFAIGVSGIAAIVFAIASLPTGVANGLFMLGVGLALIGCGVFFGWCTFKVAVLLYRLFEKLISKLIQRRYDKNEKK